MLNKVISLILAFVLACAMAGCADNIESTDITESSEVSEKYQVEFNMSIDVTNVDFIELVANEPEDTELIGDFGKIKHITDNINALMLVDTDEATAFDEKYQLTWFDYDDNIIDKIGIISDNTVVRDGRYYNITDSGSKIDTEYYADILSAPIRIKTLDKMPDLPDAEGYHEYISADTVNMTPMLFRSTAILTDICFSRLEDAPDGRSYGVEHKLYTFDELRPERWFAADVVFYGSMTTYGISFKDADGQAHRYAINQSGRNGALILTEY